MENKYKVEDLVRKVNKLIDTSNNLGNDYKTKHNELLSLFKAFEVMSIYISKHNDSVGNECEALINDLMKLIKEKSDLLKPDHEEEMDRLKKKQKEIMNKFKETGRGLSDVVIELKDVFNKMEQEGGHFNQNGGSKLTKKNKHKYKYR